MVARWLAHAVLLAGCGAVGAEEAQLKLRPGMMGVADLGASECRLFNDMYPFGPTGLEQQVLTWLQGYIYGQSSKTIDEVLAELPSGHGWDFDSLTRYIVEYCARTPEAKVADAGVALWGALREGNTAPR